MSPLPCENVLVGGLATHPERGRTRGNLLASDRRPAAHSDCDRPPVTNPVRGKCRTQENTAD